MTITEAYRRQATFRARLIRAVLRSMDKWARSDWRPNVVKKQMVRLGPDVAPNPPPGPLGIRKGRLARTVRSEKAVFNRNVFTVALKAGGKDGVEYARIHEKGGRAGRGHLSFIPKRPYMRPGYDATKRKLSARMQKGIDDEQRKVFGV